MKNLKFIFAFSTQNYHCAVGFVTICKSSFFDLFHHFLLLYENFMCSFSTMQRNAAR